MRVRKGRKETRPTFNYNFGSQKVLRFSAQKHSSNFSAQKHFTKILLGYWVVGGWGGGSGQNDPYLLKNLSHQVP